MSDDINEWGDYVGWLFNEEGMIEYLDLYADPLRGYWRESEELKRMPVTDLTALYQAAGITRADLGKRTLSADHSRVIDVKPRYRY
tara:strand:+ start:498 stop:755 length:258 start_codon:yes stop_codon:yes gene_type:complete